MNIEKTLKNLELRGFKTRHFATGEEAVAYLTGEIKNASVGFGGSKTLEAIGAYEALQKENTVVWHWKEPGRETLDKAALTDFYLSSANAISEGGEILNIDGNGNRLASTLFGHKKLFIVAGTNKICPDFDSALYRARNVAAVKNCARFKKDTPCQTDGKCHDCRHAQRICRGLAVLWAPMSGMETEVILIDQELGM